jgi:FMN phosphatase YigB (HAD superfamily)
MPRIDAVVFDFGNVLAMVDRLAGCRALARHTRLSAQAVCALIWGGEMERLSETGAWDEGEHFRRVREAIHAHGPWSHEEFLVDFSAGFTLNPEGLAALRLARDRGSRVFVLSNTSYSHSRYLFAQEELVRIPEGHVFSFKVGTMKPDPAIWRHLLTSHCLAADRCLYIDDIQHYCEAAAGLGFRTIHYVKGKTDLLAILTAALDP